MKIRNNLMGLNTLRNMNRQTRRLEKSTGKLASGLRVSSAADDAAGLSISEKMRAQIRGLRMAARNAQDAQSYFQTKEGTLQEVHDMIHRMRELAVQSLNDTFTDEDRLQNQEEFLALQDTMDEITKKSEFNTKPLFDSHQAAFYQIEGNQTFDGLIHIIDGLNSDLIISVDNQIVQITMEGGHWPPDELADLLDSKLMEVNSDLVIDLTDDGYFALQAEGRQSIDYVSGGLSFLFYEYVVGNPPGMIIGATEFEPNGRLYVKPDHNDSLSFRVGTDREYTIYFDEKADGYSITDLVGIINHQLQSKGEEDVEALVVSDRHIALTSSKYVITGLSGNVIAIDGYTSVLYDIAEHGMVSKSRGYVRGAKDLSGGVEITRDENDTLRFRLNNSGEFVHVHLLDDGEDTRTYTLDGLIDKLNFVFQERGIQASADKYSNRLQINSEYYGKGSRIQLDTLQGTYQDLFVHIEEKPVGPSITTGVLRRARVQGRFVLGENVEISTGVNDEIRLRVDGVANMVVLGEGSYTQERLVDAINIELKKLDVNAQARFETSGDRARLIIEHTSESKGSVTLLSGSNSYLLLFSEASYVPVSTPVRGTTTWPQEGIVGEPEETSAVLTGRADVSQGVTIGANNDELSLVVSGTHVSVTLQHDTFSAVQLRDKLAEELEGQAVIVSLTGDHKHLVFTTEVKGESQYISTVGGTAYNTLLALKRYDAPNTSSSQETHSTLEGRKFLSEGMFVDSPNNSLHFTYEANGTNYELEITLDQRQYDTGQELADALQAKIGSALGEKGLDENSLEVSLTSQGHITIRAAQPGPDYKLSGFSGTFYESAFERIDITSTPPTVLPGSANDTGNQLTYIVGREALTHDIVIHPHINDVFIFDFYHNSQKHTFELRLAPGLYSPAELVDHLQEKINHELVNKDMKANFIKVDIGGVSSGTAVDDADKLVIKHVPPDDGKNNSGKYIIDGVRGSAAFTVFYKSQGDPRPSHTIGTRDLSQGVLIEAGMNDTLTMDVNSKEYSIRLDPGQYRADDLLLALNEALKEEGLGLTASFFEDRLKLSFEEPGMDTIEAVRGNASGTLFYEVSNRSSQDLEHFQIGANSGQALVADHSRISVELLRINTIMIHTVEFAAKALARLDDALSNVSGERGRLGALHNRLEAAIQHSGIYQENLAAAESRIRDADMALEIMEHIKASILQQSASAMLVHANLAPQSILDILG